MKTPIFEGAGVAIVTPFNADGSINYEKFAELIDFQVKNHTDAIIVCGTTGEASTTSDEEHQALIRFAVQRVKGRVPVIAGTGSNDTEYATYLSIKAKEDGADALLLVTPYYNKTSQAGLVAHFKHTADRVDLPIILYNVPSRTGVCIAVDTYKELSEHKNIVAAKEASGNISHIAKVSAETDLVIYSGNDDQITPIMSLGARGVISVSSNCIPKETHDIVDLYLKGRVKESCELQLKYLDFMNNLFCDVNPIPVKEAMNLMGMNVGECRLPLVGLSTDNKEKLKNSMKKIGLI